jgi:hypothetical protein
MTTIRKILTCRSNSRGAMIAIYCSIPLMYLTDSNQKTGSHSSMEARLAASVLVIASAVVAQLICRNCRTAA